MKKIYKHPAIEFVRLDMKAAIMLNASQEYLKINKEEVDDDQKPAEPVTGWGTQW